MSDINISVTESADSDRILQFVQPDFFADSETLTESQKEQIERDGAWGAWEGDDGEIMLVIDGGDEPIATGLYL